MQTLTPPRIRLNRESSCPFELELNPLLPPEVSVGLALSLSQERPESWGQAGMKLLVPDTEVHWLSVQDVAPRVAARFPDRLITVRRTSTRFGMPSLDSSNILSQWMLQAATVGCGPRLTRLRLPDRARADGTPRWRPVLRAVLARLNHYNRRRRRPSEGWHPRSRFATGDWSAAVPVSRHYRVTHLPVPYIGFPETCLPNLWDHTTHIAPDSRHRTLTTALRAKFIDDFGKGLPVSARFSGRVIEVLGTHPDNPLLGPTIVLRSEIDEQLAHLSPWAKLRVRRGDTVESGDVVGHHGPMPPAGWSSMSFSKKWRIISEALGRQALIPVLRNWFDGQLLRVRPGLVHGRADLVALAAKDHAGDGSLCWDVNPAMSSFEDKLGCFLFSPLSLHEGSLVGVFPGEVAFNLNPPA